MEIRGNRENGKGKHTMRLIVGIKLQYKKMRSSRMFLHSSQNIDNGNILFISQTRKKSLWIFCFSNEVINA